MANTLEAYLAEHGVDPSVEPKAWEAQELAETLAGVVERLAESQELMWTIRSFTSAESRPSRHKHAFCRRDWLRSVGATHRRHAAIPLKISER